MFVGKKKQRFNGERNLKAETTEQKLDMIQRERLIVTLKALGRGKKNKERGKRY